VAELRDAGIRLPIIATGGIRTFDDCREYFWAGADAVSLGSAVWLTRMPLYALGPLEGLRIRRLIDRLARFEAPAALAVQWATHVPPALAVVAPPAVGEAATTDPDAPHEPALATAGRTADPVA